MSSAARYSLLYNEYEESPILRLPFERFSTIVVSLPLIAFIFCIIYSILYNFESSTYTHCHVFNVLPSISAAIGNYTPQRHVWQIAVALHIIPRFSLAFIYLKHNQKILYSHDQWISNIACILNIIENIALFILSFWTSSSHYPVHEKAFITFILMSEFYMILSCFIQTKYKKKYYTSLKWKKRLVFINIVCILTATYFFIRHNSFCEPYVYSLFALAEYIVVLTNMAFHMTAYLDFKNKDLILYKYSIGLIDR